MKKRRWIFLALTLVFTLSGCGKTAKTEEDHKKWDCSVIAVEASMDDAYIITYSEEAVASTTGTLTVQNRNDFPITVHLQPEEGEERVHEVAPGGTSVLYQLGYQTYTVGCHADVEAGTEIKCTLYDGEYSEHYITQ